MNFAAPPPSLRTTHFALRTQNKKPLHRKRSVQRRVARYHSGLLLLTKSCTGYSGFLGYSGFSDILWIVSTQINNRINLSYI